MTGDSAGQPEHERVYRALRELILFGEVAPGDAVTIQGVTNRLNAGTTPVREALRRLISDGALVFKGNRRISVPQLDATTLEDLRFAREALEPVLASRAAEFIDSKQIGTLREIDAKLDQAIARGDIQAYLARNYDFHNLLYDIARAPVTSALVDGLWLRFGPSLRVVCGQVGTRGLPDLHKSLLDALERRDGPAAAEAILGDLRQGMEQIRLTLAV